MTDRQLIKQIEAAAKQCADLINALPTHTAKFECIRRITNNTVGRIDFQPPHMREAWLTELRDKCLEDLALADVTYGPAAGHA